MQRLTAAAMVSVMLLAMPGCSGGNADQDDPDDYFSGVLQVGVNTDIPGWSDLNNGVWQGFDIAVSEFLGAELGFRPQFVPLTTEERMTRLIETSRAESGEAPIDMVVSNFSMTDERRVEIDLAGPYFEDKQSALVLAKSPLQRTEELKGRRVCISQGSTNEVRIPLLQAVGVPERTLERCIEQLRAGTVVAVSSDLAILESFAGHQAGLRVLGGPLGSERYGVGLPNNRPKLCEAVREALAKFVKERWDQVFTDNLPGISRRDRKPNADALTPCEQPSAEAASRDRPATTDPALPARAVLARRVRGRRGPRRPGVRGSPARRPVAIRSHPVRSDEPFATVDRFTGQLVARTPVSGTPPAAGR